MRAWSSSNETGNTTGDIWSRTTRSMLVWSDFEPQIVNRFPFLKSGAKKGMPWMWSQCAWVRKMSPAIGSPSWRSTRVRPSSRIPVPASRMINQPSPVRTSTQGVLPPYRTVLGPGLGMEPRVPQKVSVRLIGQRSHSNLRALLQRVAVGHRNAAALDADEPLLLEFLHGPRHGLAAGADHLGDGLVRERLIDRRGPGLSREVQEEPRDPAGDV